MAKVINFSNFKEIKKGGVHMSYNVLDVARYIINYGNSHYYNISNLKLQKILYFVQATFLVNKNEPCFNEEIEAWDFGPVAPEVYHEFKRYGSNDIPFIEEYIDSSNGIWSAERKKYTESIILFEDREMINAIIEGSNKYSASDLVKITHCQSPWMDAYIPGWNNIISKDAIYDFFIGD